MSQFTEPLIVELVGKNLWKLVDGFEYHVGEYPSKEIIKIPPGTITNFASVPRIFWPIISPIDNHAKAAVIHDYCYYIQYDKKKECDDLFLEGMTVLGVKKWKRYCMYWSVRLFAWIPWLKAKTRHYKRLEEIYKK